MNQVISFVSQHQIFCYYVLCVAVDQLPMPNGNKFYSWFFGVSHALAANINRAKVGFINGYKTEEKN